METVYHMCSCDAPLKLRLSYGTWGTRINAILEPIAPKAAALGHCGDPGSGLPGGDDALQPDYHGVRLVPPARYRRLDNLDHSPARCGNGGWRRLHGRVGRRRSRG